MSNSVDFEGIFKGDSHYIENEKKAQVFRFPETPPSQNNDK